MSSSANNQPGAGTEALVSENTRVTFVYQDKKGRMCTKCTTIPRAVLKDVIDLLDDEGL